MVAGTGVMWDWRIPFQACSHGFGWPLFLGTSVLDQTGEGLHRLPEC